MKLKDDKFKVMAIALTPHEEEEEVAVDEEGNVIESGVSEGEETAVAETTETTENSEN